MPRVPGRPGPPSLPVRVPSAQNDGSRNASAEVPLVLTDFFQPFLNGRLRSNPFQFEAKKRLHGLALQGRPCLQPVSCAFRHPADGDLNRHSCILPSETALCKHGITKHVTALLGRRRRSGSESVSTNEWATSAENGPALLAGFNRHLTAQSVAQKPKPLLAGATSNWRRGGCLGGAGCAQPMPEGRPRRVRARRSGGSPGPRAGRSAARGPFPAGQGWSPGSHAR